MARKEWAAGMNEHKCDVCGKSRRRRHMARALNGPDGAYICRSVRCVRRDATRMGATA